MISTLFRAFSYLYHAVLCLLLFGVGMIAYTSQVKASMAMLPWSGDILVQWLIVGSLAGLICILLAVTGWFRFLFPLWALAILVLMVRGYLLQPYTFTGKTEFYYVLGMIAAALVAFLASLTLLRSSKKRSRLH